MRGLLFFFSSKAFVFWITVYKLANKKLQQEGSLQHGQNVTGSFSGTGTGMGGTMCVVSYFR